MPSPRYTVRLPSALDQQVQDHLRTSGTSFTVLIREALSAYLADSVPTGVPTAADRADSLQPLGEQLALLRTRVEALERVLTVSRQVADRHADRVQTAADRDADTPPTPADSPRQTEGCPPFDPAKSVLGRLCPRGHEWGSTGQSLRRLPNLSCRACENLRRREKRAAQR
jgi:hypothetical protein